MCSFLGKCFIPVRVVLPPCWEHRVPGRNPPLNETADPSPVTTQKTDTLSYSFVRSPISMVFRSGRKLVDPEETHGQKSEFRFQPETSEVTAMLPVHLV